jgi:hypothetical protein
MNTDTNHTHTVLYALGSGRIYDKVVIMPMNASPGRQKKAMQEIQSSLLHEITAGFSLPQTRLLQVQYMHIPVILQVTELRRLHCPVYGV